MGYNIERINTMPRTANYSTSAEAEWDAGNDSVIEEYTLRFERDFAKVLADTKRDDIGGLIVYVHGNTEVAVCDYENFCGWVL